MSMRVTTWKEAYRDGPARSSRCRVCVGRKSRRVGRYPLVDVGRERGSRLWHASRLRSRHVCCFHWCAELRLNRGARGVYAWIRGEEGLGLVVVVEVSGGRE